MAMAVDSSVRNAWLDVLGPERVLTGEALAPYLRNVTGSRRDVPCALLPESTDEVLKVVDIANRFRAPLYPFSRGCNWGLGSRLPVRSGSALVDLQRMNTIDAICPERLYAVVEPGVTQGQLFDEIRDRGHSVRFNATGSSREASLIGNALDRGIGYVASRAGELRGLEVVLGNGALVRTGFAHLPDCQTKYLYAHGVGPGLDGLFAQSNFGIVTRAGIPLIAQPERSTVLLCRMASDEAIGPFLDGCRDLYRAGSLSQVLHLGNRHRAETSLAPTILEHLHAEGSLSPGDDSAEAVKRFFVAEGFGAWSAICGLHGSARMVKAAQRDIRDRLGGIVDVTFLDDRRFNRIQRAAQWLRFLPTMRRKLAVMPSVREILNLSHGIPTSDTVKALYWSIGEPIPADPSANPDQSDRCGFLYFLPMMPLSGDIGREVVEVIDGEFASFGFIPYLTLNVLDERVLEAVLNVSFDRSDEAAAERAGRMMAAVRSAFRSRGWMPYRVGVDEMEEIVDPEDSFWQTAADLKSMLDPNGIIAPGRYNLV